MEIILIFVWEFISLNAEKKTDAIEETWDRSIVEEKVS